jgi:signal transduction histidine kinase/DNA-binding response OmpR family regulator
MQTLRQDKIMEIFDEVARGSTLDRALTLIADQVAAHLSAPTCKIWVVKRGDICERCPLSAACTNRQMCMHLVATSGAAIDKEYPRIPLSAFNASLIARGGAADFRDPVGAGEKLFGLQHGAPNDGSDSYALFPLRGVSGTVGLIGVFNHRAIEADELQQLAELAPAAVAAIRVAELQSRYDALRARLNRLDKEAAQSRAAQQSSTSRQRELEEAVVDLTQQIAELQVERESLLRAQQESFDRAAQLEEENRKQQERTLSLETLQQDSARSFSEMAAQFEAERHSLEDERAWLTNRISSLEQNLAELGKQREAAAQEIDRHNMAAQRARAELEAARRAAQEAAELKERIRALEESNAGLRDHNTAITESVDDLERSLRIAEDARARLEQARLSLEQRLTESAGEAERLRRENSRISGENEQLAEETERLRGEVARLEEEAATQIERESDRIVELEKENAALLEANAQMEGAIKQFETTITRLEESAVKLRERAEANDRARFELEQRNRTLMEQNRRLALEGRSKSQFLSHLSHELRTPMNAIIGFTSLLSEDRSLQLSDRHRRSLERVARNARDLLELINNVLDFSKIEAGRMDVYSEPTSASDLIERAVAVVEPLKDGRQIRLAIEVEDGLPAMRTDRTKLQQILINLLSNAIKFTREGEVKVTASHAAPDRIRIAVSDTGIGIDESDIPKIFEEFRQVGAHNRGARAGTGLGLTITRRLVELLGGEISVTSRAGAGSTFAVSLPLEIEGRAAQAAELPAQPLDPDRTALVIDGDPASLFLTKKYLTEAGYSVAATDDAARGLEIARMAKPAVITVDLDLAEGGLKVLGQIAAGDNEKTLIAISTEAGFEREALGGGADAFLRKPIERADLLRVVERSQSDAQGRVLVVDDDPDALDLVVAMIEESGYEIHTATNGREALDQITEARPDAIILDLMLPEMDGFEVVHRLSLNPEWRSIPVILLTARDLSHEERRALDIGTARIIQKGNFSRDELLGEIRMVTAAAPAQAATRRHDAAV